MPFLSQEAPAFNDQTREEWIPASELILIDLEKGQLTVSPQSSALLERTYAVYVTGNVAVNQTI